MRIEAEYALRATPGDQDKAAKLVDAFHASFLRDLGTAAASSGDPDVAETASTLQTSEATWQTLLRQMLAGRKVSDAMEAKAHEVEKGIDWLSFLVARKGSINRDDARATVSSGMTLAISSAFGAFLICAVTSWLISRGLTGPLETNVSFAEKVAGGVYDAEAPKPSNDEFGDLTRSVATMRDKLVDALRSQEVLGKLSQERVGLALEEAAEGILIVAGDGTVQIANGPLMRLLRVAAGVFAAGASFRALEAAVRAAGGDGNALLSDASADGEADFERQLGGGRWVRISRRRTDEGGLVAVLADVSEERRQRDALALAKEDLDGALDNMSQGLAVFGPDGLLRLSNARFHELTGTGSPNRAGGESHAALAAAAARSRSVAPHRIPSTVLPDAAWLRSASGVPAWVSMPSAPSAEAFTAWMGVVGLSPAWVPPDERVRVMPRTAPTTATSATTIAPRRYSFVRRSARRRASRWRAACSRRSRARSLLWLTVSSPGLSTASGSLPGGAGKITMNRRCGARRTVDP